MDNQGNNDNDNACQDMSFTPEDEMQSSTTSEWENVSRDTCQWSLLIGQLEDVALLEAILRYIIKIKLYNIYWGATNFKLFNIQTTHKQTQYNTNKIEIKFKQYLN